jgi:hypothetical protein
MTVQVEIWSIRELLATSDKINEQPRYQRGAVWKDRKRAVLIDSILRGIDIPKLYLRKLLSGPYDYEVADGQQRLTAIQRFASNDLALLDEENNGVNLGRIGQTVVAGLTHEELPPKMQKEFLDYKLTVAVIDGVTNAEIRTLFARLQLGERLVPAEKRNAIICKIGTQLESIALNHDFFTKSRIPTDRYKHHDYLAHAYAVVHYNNAHNLKAPLLDAMFRDTNSAASEARVRKLADVLDRLRQIDEHSSRRVINKYSFVDLFWLLWTSAKLKSINAKALAEAYDQWESDRLAAMKHPLRDLIAKDKSTPRRRSLYDYTMAFSSYAGYADRIATRNAIFSQVFKQHLG